MFFGKQLSKCKPKVNGFDKSSLRVFGRGQGTAAEWTPVIYRSWVQIPQGAGFVPSYLSSSISISVLQQVPQKIGASLIMIWFFPIPRSHFCVCSQIGWLGLFLNKFPTTSSRSVRERVRDDMIRTHVSKVAPWPGTFWRTLFQLSYRTTAITIRNKKSSSWSKLTSKWYRRWTTSRSSFDVVEKTPLYESQISSPRLIDRVAKARTTGRRTWNSAKILLFFPGNFHQSSFIFHDVESIWNMLELLKWMCGIVK